MPGINSGLSPDDPTLVAAFRPALLHQVVWILDGILGPATTSTRSSFSALLTQDSRQALGSS